MQCTYSNSRCSHSSLHSGYAAARRSLLCFETNTSLDTQVDKPIFFQFGKLQPTTAVVIDRIFIAATIIRPLKIG